MKLLDATSTRLELPESLCTTGADTCTMSASLPERTTLVMHLEFADGTVLRLMSPERQDPVTILPGLGAHRLQVPAEVEAITVAEGCTVVQLGGELQIEHSAGPRWIGSFTPVPVPLDFPGSGWPVNLVVPVTDAQILALEDVRNGEDLRLRLDVAATLPQSTGHPLRQVQDIRVVAASAWEDQLRQLGRAVSFTVTIPIPMDAGPLSDAAGHLRAADQQITQGEFTDAIREVRLAIEIMRDMRVWPRDVTKKRDDQDQADRYGLVLDKLAAQADGYADLMQALFTLASGPQHASGALRGAVWARADAVALTAAASAILHRIAAELTR